METGLFEIQADHLQNYRENRQILSDSRDTRGVLEGCSIPFMVSDQPSGRRDYPTAYSFGGNSDCGGETVRGLAESWVERCAGCCAGFGNGVWTG
jgi:hypothetical protein